VTLNNLDQYQQAITYFDKALEINPNYAYALAHKGDALSNLDQYQQAITYFDKALTIDPNNDHALSGKRLALDKV
jgi:tetratricopeptide (TPR) repeat protein